MMAGAGILGEYKGSQAREVMMKMGEYEKIRDKMEAERQAGYKDMAKGEDDSEPAYITEGQKGYVAVDDEQD